MASSTVVLGPVTFTDREVPDKMPFGGKQAMAVHKLLGGQRVIDIMGPDPDPIKWSGLFYGPNASNRARLLDALKDTGAQIRLTWGTFAYNVVISHFAGEYKHEWEVHYEIEVIIADKTAVLPLPALESLIERDWGATTAIPGLPDSVLSAIGLARVAIQDVKNASVNGDLANASLASLLPAIAAVENAYNAVDAELKKTQSSIQGISLDVGQGNTTLEGFNAFQTEASNAAYASNLLIARAYTGRIVGNLTTLGG